MELIGADPGGVQSVRTPACRTFDWGALFEKNSVNKYHRECIKTHDFDIRNTKVFWPAGPAPSTDLILFDAFGARPPVSFSDGLDTRPCKILDQQLIDSEDFMMLLRRFDTIH